MSQKQSVDAVDLRVAHLNMIQAIIARLSGFSASAKNFCVTICAAIIAVAFQRQAPLLNWAAVGVVALFFLMDTYYLSLERRYRDFYEDAAKRPLEAAPDMSLKAKRMNLAAFARAMASVSVLPFYALLMASMAGLLYAANHVQQPTSQAPAVGAGGPAGAAENPAKQPASQPLRIPADANTVGAR